MDLLLCGGGAVLRGEFGGVGNDGTLIIFKFCNQFKLVKSTSTGGESILICLVSNMMVKFSEAFVVSS